jgi:hypothetical protein
MATQHVVTTATPVEVAFHCGSCDFAARVVVEGHGVGAATSFIVLDRRHAREAAATEAAAEAHHDAQVTAAIAPCPRCMKRSRRAVASYVVRSLLVGIGWVALGFTFWWLLTGWLRWLMLGIMATAATGTARQRRTRYALASTLLRDVRPEVVLPRAEVRSLPAPPAPRPAVEPARVEPTPASDEPHTLR